MSDFKKLRVWQKARELANAVYAATNSFPRVEEFRLTNQMRRAAISIGCNIAEGCGRESEADKARFVRIASGSLSELEFQIVIATDQGFLSQPLASELASRVEELGRMLGALNNSIKKGIAAAAGQ